MYQTSKIIAYNQFKHYTPMKYPKKYAQKSFILLLIEAKKSDISNLKTASELEFYHKHKAKFERFLNQ